MNIFEVLRTFLSFLSISQFKAQNSFLECNNEKSCLHSFPCILVLLFPVTIFIVYSFSVFCIKMKTDVSIFLFSPVLAVMIHTEYLLLYLAFFTLMCPSYLSVSVFKEHFHSFSQLHCIPLCGCDYNILN